jgi:hypothetical protein
MKRLIPLLCLVLVAANVFRLSGATIVVQPQSQAVMVGSTAIFTVSAAGTPPFTYTWYTNYGGVFAKTVLNETNCSLVLTNVTTNMAGFFRLYVGDSNSTAMARFAHLAVMSPGMETNGFRITLGGTTNTSWLVDYTTEANSTNWLRLATVAIPRFPPRTNFVDLNATNLNRFYRVTSVGQ